VKALAASFGCRYLPRLITERGGRERYITVMDLVLDI
jgi:hypothetical protein